MMMNSLKIPFLLLLLFLGQAHAAENDKQYLLTEKTYNALNAVQELIAADSYAKAETQLTALLKKVSDKPYEKAIVQQTLGYLYSSQENYKQAAVFFQQALDSGALPDKVSHNLKYNLAQLLLADEQYKAGLSMLEAWLKVEASPPNSAYVLLASGYYRVKNYPQVVKHISTAIERDKSTSEAWHQLLLSAHLELKQYKAAIKVLETLITLYPYQKNYWNQLTALYLQQNKEFTALAVRMLSQRLELGDGKTLISLADMYRYLHIPYKSAQLLNDALEKGTIAQDFDNLTRLADSWLAAKEAEKAATVLQQVAELDDSGESDFKHGRVLIGLEHWQQAVQPLTRSLQKLSGKEVGSASLLLGMAHFYNDDLAAAKEMFTKAVDYENERNQAGQWLRHVTKQMDEDDAA
jgi:tetratricopeptide (TPR) repeat protein